MTLRIATRLDIDPIADLGALMHSESGFSSMNYDRQIVKDTVSSLIDSGQFAVVKEINGAVVGGMIGTCTRSWFGKDMVANDLALFIHPEHRSGTIAMRLIDSFVKWARLAGAKQIRPGVSTGNLGAIRIYESLGFVNCGACFVMEI